MKNKQSNKTKNNNVAIKNTAANSRVTSAPAAVGSSIRRPVPKVQYLPDGGCRIHHKEYIRDISGASGDPTIYKMVMNPQNSITFPWLSAIALRYELYKFLDLKLVYMPSAGTDIAGYMVMGMDFDSYDEAPDKQAMMNWQYAGKTAPWGKLVVDCKSALAQLPYKYCEFNTVGDDRVTNAGNMWILASATPPIFIGEICVEYTVEFKQPALKSSVALYTEYKTVGTPNPQVTWSKEAGNISLKQEQGAAKFILDVPGTYLVTNSSRFATSKSQQVTSFAPAQNNTNFTSSLYSFASEPLVGIRQDLLTLSSGAVQIFIDAVGAGVYTGLLNLATFKE